MTKKHFIALAKALAQTQGKLDLADFEHLVEAVAEVCASASPAFNFTAFYAAVKAEPFVKPSHGTTRTPGGGQAEAQAQVLWPQTTNPGAKVMADLIVWGKLLGTFKKGYKLVEGYQAIDFTPAERIGIPPGNFEVNYKTGELTVVSYTAKGRLEWSGNLICQIKSKD